ncbi:MAG: glycosyltransferase family 39 protein [Candidatus Eisenbacteria bacterium]|nr:glycosyltransferase family 39 protein [Candidatus Eisenbacteria bacterium]
MARDARARRGKTGAAKSAGATRRPAAPSLSPLWAVAAGTLALLAFVLVAHRTPLYGVETDLLGDLIPAARALRAGHIVAAHYEFKGPGYPALLAIAGAATGDDWLAARLLNVIAAGLGAWYAARMAARFLGAAAGLFVTCGLFLNPVWMLAGIEAGSDMPAFALSMAATDLALSARRPATWGCAGLLAAAAILTRSNAVSLVPAALVAMIAARPRPGDIADPKPAPRGGGPVASLALYAAGLALPLTAWALIGRIATHGAIQNRNYLNVAFEIYGKGGTWDGFWLDAGRRFHSLLDVLKLDPPRVAAALGRNAALRWSDDVRKLVPIALGIPALIGMVLVWPRRKGAPAVAAHFLFAYLVLTSVFYNTRFFLYLTPFYLMGAAALIFAEPGARTGRARPRWPAIPPAVRVAVAVGLLLVSAIAMRSEARARYADEPYEIHAAAETLRRLAPHGGRIMARKPHIAYFAGMDFVPLPQVDTFLDLYAAARETHADYLFYSGLEAHLRSQFWLLDLPNLAVPGLERVEERAYTPTRYYVLYRFTPALSDSAAIVASLLRTLTDFARLRPNDARVQFESGRMLIRMDRPAEAVPYLTAALRVDPGAPQALEARAAAYFAAGDLEHAADDCEHACSGRDPFAGSLRLLGLIRLAQSRADDAGAAFRRAVEREPANPRLLFELALVERALGDAPRAAEALDRSAALDPAAAAARRAAVAAIAPGLAPVSLLARVRNAGP